MNHIIASTLYLKSNGRVCSFCKGIIDHRRPFRALGKMALTVPQGYSDLRVKVASCQQGHEWVELYDGRDLRTAFGNASPFRTQV
jgi:hypothetical protein